MDAVGADEDVALGGRSVIEPRGHAGRPLFVFRERLAETRVILQSRQEAPSEHTSINLAADVPASLPVLQVEADTRQLSRAVVEKHERAASAGTPGRRPDEIVIPLRQAGAQGLAPRVVDRQAISLTADVGPGVAL